VTDTLLLIGGRLQAIEKANAMGLRVVFLQHKDRLLPGQAETADALLLVDYRDPKVALPLVRAAHEVYGFTATVSLVEQATELVGRINDDLGLRGTSYNVAHRFHDKLVMRQWLDEMGFESVAASSVSQLSELLDFGDQHGYPVVLKPVDGTGSRGVVRIDGPHQAEGAWQRAQGLRGRTDLAMAKFYPVDRFIVEEYIDGPEYSAETFSFDGNHVIVSFTDKLTDGVVEVGHAQPAALSQQDEAVLEDYIVRYLQAMGLRDGVSHVEVKLSARGPRIIEGHDRVAGDRVMDLVQAVYGIDLEKYAVGWPFRQVPALSERPTANGGAATRFLTAEPGVVTAIDGVEEVRGYPGVLDLDVKVRVGDRVGVVTENFDRSGQVLVIAEDTASASQLCESLDRKVRIHTTATSG